MDTDFDESMDAFKESPGFTNKKIIAHKKIVSAKRSTKTGKQSMKQAGNKSMQKKLPSVAPVCSDIDSVFENETLSQTGDAVNELSEVRLRPCPTCGKMVDLDNLKRHTRACLKANFAACKAAIGSNEILRTRPKTPQKLDMPGGSNSNKEDHVFYEEQYLCPTCSSDLTLLSKDQRNVHLNRCFDHYSTLGNIAKTSPKSKPVKKSKLETDKDLGLRCLICAKEVKSHAGLKRHYKACQKKNKFSTMTALTLNRPGSANEVDVELLAEIRRVEDRAQDETLQPKVEKVIKKKAAKRGRPKKNIESYNNEMLRLAIAVSNNENLDQKRLKKIRNLPPPAMTSSSPNTKRRELQDRLNAIANPTLSGSDDDDDDDEIPSTPALPTTALRLPSVRANVRVISNSGRYLNSAPSGGLDSDQPGPSHMAIQNEPLIPQQVVNVIPANLVMEPQILQSGVNYPNLINVIQPDPIAVLPPSPVMEPQSPRQRNQLSPGELQSPEVSSSNIKNNSSSDMNESLSVNAVEATSQEREVQCDQVTDHRPTQSPSTSKWTMTRRNLDSSFRVRGLLSQFEPRNVQQGRQQRLPSEEIVAEEIPANEESVSVNTTNVEENIDSTLMAIEALNSDRAIQDAVASNTQSQSSQQGLSLQRHDSQSTNSSQAGPLSFVRLLDHPQFSDAKILVGGEKEAIYLHQNILYCSCPNLLKEIEDENAKGKDLWLQDFSKSEIMPLLRFLYTGKIDCLISDRIYSKSKLLIERFNIMLSENDQQLFDSQSTEEIFATPLPVSPKMPESETDTEMQSDNVATDPLLDNLIEESVLSEPEPSFEEEILPQNLTQKDPDFPESPSPPQSFTLVQNHAEQQSDVVREQSLTSDCDMFDFETPGASTDNVDFDESFVEPPTKLADKLIVFNDQPGSCEHTMMDKISDGSKNTDTENVDDSEVEQDMITSEKNDLMETSSQDSFASSDICSSQDDESSDSPDFKKKLRKRKRLIDSPVQRKSKRRSLGKNHNFWRGCPCCKGDSDSPTKIKMNNRNRHRYVPSPLADRKSIQKCSVYNKKQLTPLKQKNVLDRMRSTPKLSPRSQKSLPQKSNNPELHSTASPIKWNIKTTPKMSPLIKKVHPRKRQSPMAYSGSKVLHLNKVTLKKTRLVSSRKSSARGRSLTPKKSQITFSPKSQVLPTFGGRKSSLSRRKQADSAANLTPTKQRAKIVNCRTEDDIKVKKDNLNIEPSSDSPKSLDNESKPLLVDSAKKPVSTVSAKSQNGAVIAKRKSITKRVRRNSSSKLSKETVYVSERLPRFKQRDHIKSRPGVANMMKNVNKVSKQNKKSDLVVPKLEMTSNEISEPQPDVMNGISMSQPVESETYFDNTEDRDVFYQKEDSEIKLKKYKFKRVNLLGYASASPNINSSPISAQTKTVNDDSSSESDISGYASDGQVFTNICFDDSFEVDCMKESKLDVDPIPNLLNVYNEEYDAGALVATYHTGLHTPAHAPISNVVSSSKYFGPVPITPMPNYQDMETPEVIKHATKFGLKKNLGKVKLRSKLQEAYLYKHLIASDNEESEIEDADDYECFENEDDLCIDTAEADQKLKLELSRLSMTVSNSQKNSDSIYTFEKLSPEEVLALSSKIVDEMFLDGSLLSALKENKRETGSIKRGSRQDQMRCWNIVTPGSSSYNPKLNAILALSEEYQSAITNPLVSCVVKNYIAYKKYQFDCVPIVCDRMQREINLRDKL
uniref:uncharacterized protein LOC120339147 n=1 Tax=Styela clava TaxID=7725 RepID=UPI00193A5925|nr:uncharacterized protein LOC120339147 [Styela clava]